ncbi:MAG: hypothetical protein RBS37_11820 [Bacteroidales bacterium]|nr:hypothetical protein [Bacteroidales bacterium]
MNNRTVITRITAICCFVVICSNVLSQNWWNQWMGAGRNGKVTGFTLPKAFPAFGLKYLCQ